MSATIPLPSRPNLEIGRIYSLDDLAKSFGVKPHYLKSAGGIVTASALNATLIFTHHPGDASFEYGDFWEGNILFYAGRGQSGDQELTGQNRDVAQNRRELWLFEDVGSSQRRFLGNPRCRNYWWEGSFDKYQQARRSLRFALELDVLPPRRTESAIATRVPTVRRPRPFDEARVPAAPTPGISSATPEQIAQMQEKASAGHHGILVALRRALLACGWTGVEEIPGAVDLWAVRGERRVIFEAKTIPPGQELAQVRSALAQLLEYRFFFGTPNDGLCIVTDLPISASRLRFLSSMNVATLLFDNGVIAPTSLEAAELLRC